MRWEGIGCDIFRFFHFPFFDFSDSFNFVFAGWAVARDTPPWVRGRVRVSWGGGGTWGELVMVMGVMVCDDGL